MKPMRYGEIDADNLDTYIADPDWWFQQKLDGVRVFVHVCDGTVTVLGRNGERKANPIPSAILTEFARLETGEFYFDGELLDGVLWLFDIAITGVSYQARLEVLERFVTNTWLPAPCVQLVATKRSAADKAALVTSVRDGNGEGIVMKRSAGTYLSGKRSPQVLKAKFVHEIDAIVTEIGVNGKANFHVALVDEAGKLIHVGICKMKDRITVHTGQVVTVRYLYVVSGRVVQPRLVSVRDDKAMDECTIDQLRFTDKHTVHG